MGRVRLPKGQQLRLIHEALDAKALHGEGGEIYNPQLLLAKKVSPRDFERVAGDNRSRLRTTCHVAGILLNGFLYAAEGNTGSRSRWRVAIAHVFLRDGIKNVLVAASGCEIKLSNTSAMVADTVVFPMHDSGRATGRAACNLIDRNTWPSVVLVLGEVRTLAELSSYRKHLFDAPGSCIRLYVVFKYYVGTQQLIAIVFSREAGEEPVQAISFGKEPLDADTLCKAGLDPSRVNVTGVGFGGAQCDKPGLVEYELRVAAPLAMRLPPEQVQVEDYKIDLFEIKHALTTKIYLRQVQALCTY